ncbi:efflux RND transporter periplasmic adaptor subunit [Zavarzinia sp.]|uniref:efflux RND transporter periplasmic adaptor subunit n=1 Tax=Zavarzinia sp. TaxID=2027920 RepID=UPI0035616CAC
MRPTSKLASKLAGAALAVLGVLAVGACDQSAAQSGEAQAPKARPVAAAEVRLAADAADVRGSGLVAYKREVALSFKIGGMIEGFTVDIGDKVTAGQQLAHLDQSEIDAQWREAEANVDKAKRDVDRIAPLVGSGFASKARLDDARTALQLAIANRDAVAFNRSLAEIKAPADGIVLAREVETGQIVPAGAAILLLGDAGSGRVVKVGLADREVVKIALGDPATVRLPGIADPATAHVSRIAPKGDPRTGAFLVELAFDDTSLQLPSGLIADAAIRPRGAADVKTVVIPAAAILEAFGSEGSVFVIDPKSQTVVRRHVTFGPLTGTDVQIRDGLTPGEQVVSVGAGYLREGDKVEVTDLVALRAGGSAQ